ncbi:MAG: dTMP kinase [Dehalococcoidia bacterium]
MFITFEGGEGAGKSSQVDLLGESIKEKGYDVKLLHEPGGTPLGEMIYSWISDPDSRVLKRLYSRWSSSQKATHLDSLAELFLFESARAQLVNQVIKPSLEQGQVVICDRFSDSTIAYQGYGRGLEIDHVRRINDIATGGLKPDLTILLDVPPKIGLQRTRGKNHRMENEGLLFHDKVRKGYDAISSEEPERFFILDGTKDKNYIQAAIWERVSQDLI